MLNHGPPPEATVHGPHCLCAHYYALLLCSMQAMLPQPTTSDPGSRMDPLHSTHALTNGHVSNGLCQISSDSHPLLPTNELMAKWPPRAPSHNLAALVSGTCKAHPRPGDMSFRLTCTGSRFPAHVGETVTFQHRPAIQVRVFLGLRRLRIGMQIRGC
jgi:hypothetical protein